MGNTVKRPAPGGGEQDLVWDELSQLTEVTKAGDSVARMVYDADSAWILRQQGTTTTLYVAGNEISLNTATSVVSANRYYGHAGQTVAVRTGASNDTVTTLVSDWQGTIYHQISNSTGALSTSWRDPYVSTRGTPPTAWTGERASKPTSLYRVYRGSKELGSYWTRARPSGPVQSIIDSALDPALGNQATSWVKVRVPSGTTFCEGAAASQGGLVGGGNQEMFIPRVDPSWVVGRGGF